DMKKIVGLAALLLLPALMLTGCRFGRRAAERVTARVDGPHTTVTAEGAAGQGPYSLMIKGLVFLSEGDVTLTVKPAEGAPRVEVDCAQELVDRHGLQAEITGDKITVQADGADTFLTDFFHVTVYAPCEYVRVEGDYQIDVDAAGVSRFGLEIAGAADGTVSNLDAEKTVLAVDGAASLTLSGAADTLSCKLNGAGTIDAKGLRAKEADLIINGAGTIKATAEDRLDATINGTGTITYYGGPEDVSQQINGMGSIRAAE
ncbi:MAG TPA: DUF2807 domain-containing protein, partial [Feifaniaceae bacterium]|nr:DUF2807 domain-containing protein [Feifaniaceae bacterium]